MKLTTRQTIAFSRPCFEAEATTDRRFGSLGRAGSRAVSVVMTVNVGLE